MNMFKNMLRPDDFFSVTHLSDAKIHFPEQKQILKAHGQLFKLTKVPYINSCGSVIQRCLTLPQLLMQGTLTETLCTLMR